MTNLGKKKRSLRLIDYRDQYCNGKLVFDDLESILASSGYVVSRVETREKGKRSAPALRIRTSSPKHLMELLLIDLGIVEHGNNGYSHKLVFQDLESVLKSKGIIVDLCSTRADGRNSPIALRVYLR